MRHLLHLGALVSATALLSACSLMPGSSPTTQGHHGKTPAQRPVQQCNTTGAQWAIGKTNTEHNINEARKRAGAYMARVLRPGQPTTREFNAERLNLEVDATGRIIKAFCG